MISGFHTSINVDVTANWLIPGKYRLHFHSFIINSINFVTSLMYRYTLVNTEKVKQAKVS